MTLKSASSNPQIRSVRQSKFAIHHSRRLWIQLFNTAPMKRAAPVQALVNTVHTVGIMGRGIALQFKRAYPAMFRDNERARTAGSIELGKVQVFDLGESIVRLAGGIKTGMGRFRNGLRFLSATICLQLQNDPVISGPLFQPRSSRAYCLAPYSRTKLMHSVTSGTLLSKQKHLPSDSICHTDAQEQCGISGG